MKRWIYWLIAVANTAALAIYTACIERDILPTHFNIRGMADDYGSKWAIMVPGALPILLLSAYEIYAYATRNNERIMKNRRLENMLIPVISLSFAAIGWIFAVSASAPEGETAPNMLSLVIILMGALIAFLGNFMGKVQPNRTFGLRTRSTLADDEVWVRAHRVCAITGTVGGLITVLGGAVGLATGQPFPAAPVGLLIGVALTVAVPALYAMNLYNARHKK